MNKTETLFGTAGVVYGLFSAYKKGESTQKVVISAAIYGLGGFLIGMAITKFYE